MSCDPSSYTAEQLRQLQVLTELSNEQIAEVLGISPKTWMNRISQGSETAGRMKKAEIEFLLLLAGIHPDYELKRRSVR